MDEIVHTGIIRRGFPHLACGTLYGYGGRRVRRDLGLHRSFVGAFLHKWKVPLIRDPRGKVAQGSESMMMTMVFSGLVEKHLQGLHASP